ncbi:DNA circularization N-terminal domain-containing protein [Escherichia coli]|uniref:DNA circularization protein n=1 Tax=Escherichia coli TaxID=562 RepID=UPI000B34B951|nr:DNA circularization N-terminal domain-containing protein [Escherichia coli]EDL2495453.1 multidrug DMT transporter permease [Salmonella enterica subsp. enterica serovar Typhimurium]EGM9565541.1 multidrug DMT transporter permease [Salmonella enterica subsp. enterica serovar Bovismorbificans]MBA8202637.1 DNA circularization N-terminal domain-containing protein [Escherichia coli]MBB0281531.1 multidrug DMT transporter permease [Escherichia coli]QMC82399.1 DNA circularization N-terminal domain-co
MGWAENLQNASFRGVQFEVLNTDEQISRDHAVYEYPFVDGADLHDLGRKARPFRMTAFLWGDDYEYKLGKLTAALDEGGDGELIHPVYGSVPSVIVTGYSIRHDAESPDSCTIDMSFLENRTGSALFSTLLPELFAQQLFDELDTLQARLSDFFDAVTAPLNTVNSMIKKAQTVRATLVNTLLSFKSDFVSTVDNIVSLAGEPGKFINELAEVLEIHTSDVGQPVQVLQRVDSATRTGLAGETTVASSATVMNCWNKVITDMDEFVALPVTLVSGDKVAEVALPVDASPDDVQDVKAVYATQAASELASVAMAILVDDAQSEQLIPADIGRLVGDVRTRLQAAITLFRERYEGERERITETASPLGLMYPEIIQSMKNVAATVQDVGLLVLSRRPPLTQKQVQADSCLLLLAWQWYGDYSRAAELQRLNPQLRDPNNITAGVVINAYAK